MCNVYLFIATKTEISSSSVSFQDDSIKYTQTHTYLYDIHAFFMGCFLTAISWSVLFSILHFHRLLHVCLFICLSILLGSMRIWQCSYDIAYGMWPAEHRDYVFVCLEEDDEDEDEKASHWRAPHTWAHSHSIVPSFIFILSALFFMSNEMGQRK